MSSLVARVKSAQKSLSRLLYSREHIADDPFMEIWKICVNAQTKGAKYLMQLMSTGDIIQEDLENRKQLVFNRARGDDDSSHGTKFRTYVHINPHMTVSPMYVGCTGIPDRDRVYATRLRLSSHA